MLTKEKFIEIMREYAPALTDTQLDELYPRVYPQYGMNLDSRAAFLNSLTPSEQKALQFILKSINYSEGTLVISKLIEQSQISRAVITNLIAKIEKYQIMEIKSRGVKGTTFKLLTELNI